MRNFQILNQALANADTGIFSLTADDDSPLRAQLALRREGDHVALSASYGAFEIALRPRLREFVRTLTHIQPIDGLNTSRQVGTGDSFLAVGLHTDGSLFLRPTILGDAAGYIALNLQLTPDARRALLEWLGVEVPQQA